MRALFWTLVVLSVPACGGGGGDISAPGGRPPVDVDPGGFWFGSVTYADQTTEELVGISTADGRFSLISVDTFGPDTVGQYIGMLDVNGSVGSGSGDAYAFSGTTWPNGATVLAFDIDVEIDEREAIVGSWTTSTGATAEFELEYDTEYERGSALPRLQGIWYVYDDTLNPEVTMTIQAGGAFAAQSRLGCQSTGQVSIIDARFNVYRWDVGIRNCAIAGDYTGFAVLGDVDTGDPAASQNNAVLVSISNDVRAILMPLER